jgi:hypothetical protein
VNWKNVREAAAWAHVAGDPAVAEGAALAEAVPAGVALAEAVPAGVALAVAVPAAVLEEATGMAGDEPTATGDDALHPVASNATESPATRDRTRISPIIDVLSRSGQYDWYAAREGYRQSRPDLVATRHYW